MGEPSGWAPVQRLIGVARQDRHGWLVVLKSLSSVTRPCCRSTLVKCAAGLEVARVRSAAATEPASVWAAIIARRPAANIVRRGTRVHLTALRVMGPD